MSGPPSELGRVGVLSPGILRIPDLAALLGAERIVFQPRDPLRPVDCVVGWGRKPNTAAARRLAARRGVPFYALEDGFLRSLGLGVDGEPPLSIVVDDQGIYYDATRPSRLEALLATADFDDAELARARRAMEAMAGLSKYNHQPDVDLGPKRRPRVLVVDQTAGDLSLRLGGCVAGGFDTMLAAAIDENPDAEILVKTHPDVLAGVKAGHLQGAGRVRLLATGAHPPTLLRQVDRVYVMTSLMGFEALLAGVPVTCFGAPFYAGWGLTDDRAPIPERRGRRRSLEEVFAAAYLRYARYVDPETGRRCGVETVIEHLALQRRLGEASRGTWVCVDFSLWKRSFLPPFLGGAGSKVTFVRRRGAARALASGPDTRLLIWGTHDEDAMEALARRVGRPLWRTEDGFLRSVGLGSDLHAPASLVLDPLGIYYDPTGPSELERILQQDEFSPAERARAAALRERIVTSGVSKYNVGEVRAVAAARGARRVVLVVGQVEDDASIARGCVDVRDNTALLRAARAARPDAYLVYKPHPDVVSGNRRGAVEAPERWADEVAHDVALDACLQACDEVHTMTSLVGFEALVYGKTVVVYGRPFYAGWGLTEDRHPPPRRTRRRDLDELVAATLIRYPRYVHPRTGRYTTPEAVVELLLAERASAGVTASRLRRGLTKLSNLARGLARGR